MRNVDWIVIAPTVACVLLVAFALWVGPSRSASTSLASLRATSISRILPSSVMPQTMTWVWGWPVLW
jgi:hypothetical protein